VLWKTGTYLTGGTILGLGSKLDWKNDEKKCTIKGQSEGRDSRGCFGRPGVDLNKRLLLTL